MKVSLKWLSEYVDVPTDIKEFCNRLDLTGTGVEAVETIGATFEGVVVGLVRTCEAHPNSDHMHVAQVAVGLPPHPASEPPSDENPDHDTSFLQPDQSGGELLQIVCGAPNIVQGVKVAVATVGSSLPGGITIKKSKLRGILSNGMCCSERELGLGEGTAGILILPEDAPVGMPLAQYLNVSDTVLDLEITPNRPDCLSVIGMAREVGAMYQRQLRLPPLAPNEQGVFSHLVPYEKGTPVTQSLRVEVLDSTRCSRYMARIIENVQVGPSPTWLVERLAAVGARSVNNIVDITNYILFLFGQPLHAFDFDRLGNDGAQTCVVVRPAHEGEMLTTLDGEQRTLTSDMTVIATPEKPLALAGVMGGLDTEVGAETHTILLEAAVFDRAHTSRTSRNLTLVSESSLRFERGVDNSALAEYLAYAAALIAQVAKGTVRPGALDVCTHPTPSHTLSFRIKRFCSLMGADIARSDIEAILTSLGAQVCPSEEQDTLLVRTPTFRPDLEREVDLYEEVLRLWGMDRVVSTLPASRARFGKRSSSEKIRSTISLVMRSCGLNETMTYSFAKPQDITRLRMSDDGLGDPVELINPLNADQSVMRQSIVPGLLRSVAYNQSRGVKNIALYEEGIVFFAHQGHKQPKERRRLAAVMAGCMHESTWNDHALPFDFFDGKGVVEQLARELAIPKLRFKAVDDQIATHMQPGRGAEVFSGGSLLGWVGEVHPLAVQDFGAAGSVVAFELDVSALIAASRPAREYVAVGSFPAVSIDVAFVVDEDISHERLVQCITSAGGALLEEVRCFDVYRHAEQLGANKKSLAFALTYRACDRTLTSEEVDRAHQRIVKKVAGATGASVRR